MKSRILAIYDVGFLPPIPLGSTLLSFVFYDAQIFLFVKICTAG